MARKPGDRGQLYRRDLATEKRRHVGTSEHYGDRLSSRRNFFTNGQENLRLRSKLLWQFRRSRQTANVGDAGDGADLSKDRELRAYTHTYIHAHAHERARVCVARGFAWAKIWTDDTPARGRFKGAAASHDDYLFNINRRGRLAAVVANINSRRRASFSHCTHVLPRACRTDCGNFAEANMPRTLVTILRYRATRRFDTPHRSLFVIITNGATGLRRFGEQSFSLRKAFSKRISWRFRRGTIYPRVHREHPPCSRRVGSVSSTIFHKIIVQLSVIDAAR